MLWTCARSKKYQGFYRFAFLVSAPLLTSVLFGCRANPSKQSSYSAPQELLAAYSNSCSASGPWTSLALAQTQRLQTLFNDLKDKDPCKPYLATLASISSVSGQINRLILDPNFADLRSNEEAVQDLTIAYTQAGDDDVLKSSLSYSLASAQLNLATSKGKYDTEKEQLSKVYYQQSTQELSDLFSNLMKDSSGISECLNQSPGAALQLAATAVALGGSFVSPVFGAGASAVATLLNTGLEFTRNHKINEALKGIYVTELPIALSCGLESMTDLYCQAREASLLLRQQKDLNEPKQIAHQPVLRALDLAARRLPIILDWLALVRTGGGEPQDSYDAQRRNAIFEKIGMLIPIDNTITGQINESIKQDESYSNPTDKYEAFVFLVSKLAYAMSGLGDNEYQPKIKSGPFSDLTKDAFKYTCYLLLGYPAANCPASPPTQFGVSTEQIRSYIESSPELSAVRTYPTLMANWKRIVSEVTTITNRTFSREINIDPANHLARFKDESLDNFSPESVLFLIQDYLTELKTWLPKNNPQLTVILDETLALVHEGLRIANDPTAEVPNPDPLTSPTHPTIPYTAADKLARLAALFRLQNGTQFFSDRVISLINRDLTARFNSGQPITSSDAEVQEILKFAGGDIQQRLLAAGLKDNQALLTDLLKANAISLGQIKTFRSYFDSQIDLAIQKLDEASVDEPERGLDRPLRSQLAELCLMTFATSPKGSLWTSKKAKKICEKAVVESFYYQSHPDLSIEIAKLVKTQGSKPLEDRICVYRKFKRANRLIETPPNHMPAEPPLKTTQSQLAEPGTWFKLLD